jgi:hypothetical protein
MGSYRRYASLLPLIVLALFSPRRLRIELAGWCLNFRLMSIDVKGAQDSALRLN